MVVALCTAALALEVLSVPLIATLTIAHAAQKVCAYVLCVGVVTGANNSNSRNGEPSLTSFFFAASSSAGALVPSSLFSVFALVAAVVAAMRM